MRLSILFDLCDERDMGFEVDVEEEGDFPFGKTLLWHEETPLKRLRAGASDSGEHIGPIVGTKRANDDHRLRHPAVAQSYCRADI